MSKVTMKEVRDTIAKHMKTCGSRIKFNKPLLFGALSAYDITKVEVEFDGCGDSGNMEEARFYRGHGENAKEVPADDKFSDNLVDGALISDETTWNEKKQEWVYTTRTPTISELVEQICYDLLESNHGGWEINEGSFGTFVFKVGKSSKESSIELQYNERIESIEEHHETY